MLKRRNKLSHEEYYSQFVSPKVEKLVLRNIGKTALLNSRDPHFNDIPLQRWDNMVPMLPKSVPDGLRQVSNWLSLGTGVCVLKQAARNIVNREKTKISSC